jgi:replicative DNA helicase
MLQACTQVVARVHEHEGDVDQLLGEVERDIQKISESRFDGGKSRVLEPRESARSFTADLQRRFDLKGALSGIGTGFNRLDKMTSGLQAGELAVIGARPSAGKTAMACSIITRACLLDGVPTAFITCEMSPSSILRRIAAGRLKIPASQLRDGSFSENDFKKLVGFNSWVSKSNLHFIDGVSGITIAQISSELRRLVRKNGVKLVIVDYLQKIRPAQSKEKRTYEVGAVSEALKGLAASLGIAFVALAQLNREPDKDKGRQPRASDLADSAQIERDADLIGLIHRPRTEEDPNGLQAKLIIAKQRDGEVGIVDLNFSPKFVEFTDAVDV